ncbi:MAG TPA: nucleotidyltransferase family protein [Acidobacteriaceae bacterium]|nr:nucleotidyltransferase family protein [Acidobacteriaceae bacterium]
MARKISIPVAILAGGLATRLRPVTETVPKVLLEVAGKPFLEHQLAQLREQGVEEVVLCVGYLGEMIRERYGDGRCQGVRISYSFDGPKLLGTGGAIRNALPLLGEAFFVMYGDSYLRIDFGEVESAFRHSAKPGLMTIYHNRGLWDVSNVCYGNGTIERYDKALRDPKMQHIDYGLSVFKSEVFAEYPADTVLDLAQVMRALVDRGQMAGFEAKERFYEIGSPEGWRELDQFLQSNVPQKQETR